MSEQRLQLRLSKTAKARIARAAAIQQMDLSTFVTDAALRDANAVIERETRIELSEQRRLQMIRALEHPPLRKRT